MPSPSKAQAPAVTERPPDQPRWLPRNDEEVPPRPALTRRRIVMTALGLVEEHGLDALTMRRVASALQVTPMSLYNHVSDKAELVDLMVDFLIGKVVEESSHDQGDWEARLRTLVIRNFAMWRDHRGFVRVYVEGVTMGPNGVAVSEQSIGLLREAGFSDEEAAAAFLMLYRWGVATLLVAPTQPVNRNRGMPPSQSPKSQAEQMGAYFSAVPLDQIPNIQATAPYLSGTSIDFGLDIMMEGLKARLAAKSDCAAAQADCAAAHAEPTQAEPTQAEPTQAEPTHEGNGAAEGRNGASAEAARGANEAAHLDH